MAGASRLVRASRALQSDDHIPSSDSCRLPSLKFLRSGGEPPGWRGRKRVAVSLDTAVVSPERKRKREPCFFDKGMEIMKLSSSRIAQVARLALGLFGPPRSEMLVEKGIIGCRYFTLIPVAGSLIGSVLCFVEGCFLVLETFVEYFHRISHRVDQGGIIHLLIEALGMFLVGTALLAFGMGMYAMFAGPSETKQNRGWQIAESSFGSFNLKKLAKSMEMQSISEAKSKIGHAILLILQTGMLEKFKNVPLASALDLACFAGAVFISSACVFLLSKLTMPPSKIRCI